MSVPERNERGKFEKYSKCPFLKEMKETNLKNTRSPNFSKVDNVLSIDLWEIPNLENIDEGPNFARVSSKWMELGHPDSYQWLLNNIIPESKIKYIITKFKQYSHYGGIIVQCSIWFQMHKITLEFIILIYLSYWSWCCFSYMLT